MSEEENKLEEAEVEFLKLIDIAPKEKLGYANLGIVYLRTGKYKEAEEAIRKAIKIDPKDPNVRLILAKVLQMNGDKESAISELKESLQFAPEHIKTLYNLSELYSTESDNESQNQREQYTVKVVENAPENLVPRLNLIEILIQKDNHDKALEQMEQISKLFPEFPNEAVEYYDITLKALQLADKKNAITSFKIFHNYLKVTSPYQAGVLDLKGPGGSLLDSQLLLLINKLPYNLMNGNQYLMPSNSRILRPLQV